MGTGPCGGFGGGQMQRRRQADVENIDAGFDQLVIIAEDAAAGKPGQRFGFVGDGIGNADHFDFWYLEARLRVHRADKPCARDSDAKPCIHAVSVRLMSWRVSRKAKFAGRPPVCRKMTVSAFVNEPLRTWSMSPASALPVY